MQFTKQERAVSPVIAAVLLFALFTTASLLWTVNTLPEWVADREEAHQQDVKETFGSLKGGMDALSAANDPGAVSSVVKLGARPVNLVQPVASSGRLAVQDGFGFEMDLDNAKLAMLNGRVPGGLPNEEQLSNPLPISGLEAVQSLLLSLQESSDGAGDGIGSLRVVADFDSGEIVTATLNVGSGSECNNGVELIITTTALVTSNIINTIDCGVTSVSLYEVDLTRPEYGWIGALNMLNGPFSLQISHVSGTTFWNYAVIGVDEDGHTYFDGAGADAFGLLDLESDSLVYEPNNQQYVDQDIIWQGGAILLDQGAGGTVSSDPSFRIGYASSGTGTRGYMEWTMVDLSGSGDLSGQGRTTVTARHLGTSDQVFTASGGEFLLSSDHVPAWNAFFREQRALSDVDAGDMCIDLTNPGELLLNLGDGCPTPATVTEWIIHLRIINVELRVQ